MRKKAQNDWVELNLPWKDNLPIVESKVKIPHAKINKRWIKLYGELPEDAVKKLFTKKETENNIEFFWQSEAFLAFEKAKDKITKELINSGLYGLDEYADSFKEERWKRLLELNNKKVNKVINYIEYKGKFDDWFEEQPEVIAFHNEMDKQYKETAEKEKKISFCGMGLNKAGTLIEVELDGETKVFLIGHINELRGVCDDCVMFDSNTIVKRYKIVWDK